MLSRLRVILVAIFFIVVITAMLVFPGQVATLATQLDEQERNVQVMLVLAASLIDVALALLIVRELPGARLEIKGLIVRSREATVEVAMESVRDTLTRHMSKLEDIFSVETAVRPIQGRVAVTMGLTARDHIDVRKKTAEVHREIVKIVEKQLGLRLADRPELRFTLVHEEPRPATFET